MRRYRDVVDLVPGSNPKSVRFPEVNPYVLRIDPLKGTGTTDTRIDPPTPPPDRTIPRKWQGVDEKLIQITAADLVPSLRRTRRAKKRERPRRTKAKLISAAFLIYAAQGLTEPTLKAIKSFLVMFRDRLPYESDEYIPVYVLAVRG